MPRRKPLEPRHPTPGAVTIMQPIKMDSGKPGEEGNSGKPKGAADKSTRALRFMVLEALEQAGGVSYLTYHAMLNPNLFIPLLARVLPLQVGVQGEVQVVQRFTKRTAIASPFKKPGT